MLEHLPDEILLEILSYVQIPLRIGLARTSRRLKQLTDRSLATARFIDQESFKLLADRTLNAACLKCLLVRVGLQLNRLDLSFCRFELSEADVQDVLNLCPKLQTLVVHVSFKSLSSFPTSNSLKRLTLSIVSDEKEQSVEICSSSKNHVYDMTLQYNIVPSTADFFISTLQAFTNRFDLSYLTCLSICDLPHTSSLHLQSDWLAPMVNLKTLHIAAGSLTLVSDLPGTLEALKFNCKVFGSIHLASLRRLREISFHQPNDLCDEGLDSICTFSNQMHTIRLCGALRLTDAGLSSLWSLRHLSHLDLSGLRSVTCNSVKPIFRRCDIRWLDLSGTNVDDCVFSVVNNAKSLHFINLSGTRCTAQEYHEFSSQRAVLQNAGVQLGRLQVKLSWLNGRRF